MRQIILETAAASRQREGSVRYWLSAGPGGYGLGPAECVGSSFYVIVFKQEAYPETYYQQGVKLITSQVPIKPPLFARIKSTNYLPNVLVVLEAKDRGADNGIFIDQRGMVAESSNMNVAFVTKDRVFRHPPFRRDPVRHHDPSEFSISPSVSCNKARSTPSVSPIFRLRKAVPRRR